jgi:toxin ParE1/3/4
MDFELSWTEPAADELEAIGDYIGQHSPAAAERTITAILNRVELLKTVPLMGRVYSKDPSGRTREVICGNYRIFYRVLEDAGRVEILTVWHSARDEPQLPD